MASTSSALMNQQKLTIKYKLLWCLILATLAIVSVIIIPSIATPRPAVDSKILAQRAMLGLTLVVGAFNFQRLRQMPWSLTDTVFASLISVFTLSTLFSGRIPYCIQYSWHQPALFLLAWTIYRLRPGLTEIRTLLWLIPLLALMASMYGFSTYSGYDVLRRFYPFDFQEEAGGRNYIHSFYGNPEYFAGYVAPAVVVLLGLSMLTRNRLKYRIACFGLMLFILAVVALSGSRSALIGLVLTSGLLCLNQLILLPTTMRKYAALFVTGLVGLGVLVVVIFSTSNPLNTRDMRLAKRFADSFNTQSASFRERVLFYLSTSNSLQENPVWGGGPGTFRLEYIYNVEDILDAQQPGIKAAVVKEMRNRLAEHAHNDYFEIWFDQGIAGIAVFLFLLAHLTMRFISTRFRILKTRWDRGALWKDFHLILYCATLTVFLNALTSFPFQMSARSTLVWILIGAFLATDRQLSALSENETVG